MTLREANELFAARRFAEALKAYQSLVLEDTLWAKVCAWQIEVCQRETAATGKISAVAAKPVSAEKGPVSEQKSVMPRALDAKTDTAGMLTVERFAADIAAHAVSLDPSAKGNPRVTVLMTSHNVIDFIEDAVYSVLFQTWDNLELIVVDDVSTDGTYERLLALSKTTGKLKVFRLNCNLGTYFAKNYGLHKSTGEYIFFQDGDDICSRRRIEICMDALLKSGKEAVRSCYARATFPDGRVFPVDGLDFKLGLVTLGLKRSVFERIGYFNCTTKASDDELFNRFRSVYGTAAIVDVKLPLYYNTLREGSLIADMIGNDFAAVGSITQKPSASRQQYVETFKEIHRTVGASGFRDFFSYPRIRDAMPVASDMSKLCNPVIPVVGNVCTFPAREKVFREMVASVIGQVDVLNVYLDKYTSAPGWLTAQAKVKVIDKKHFPAMRDNGKFIALGQLTEPCFYFTFDDDIVYPPDYVNTMVKTLEEHDRQIVAGCHGVVLEAYPQRYFSKRRLVYSFDKALPKAVLCNNLGTGTVAFHSDLCRDFRVTNEDPVGMVDILFSVYCKVHRIPMVAVARHAGWLTENGGNTPSLYDEFVQADDVQSSLIRQHAPWGQEALPFDRLGDRGRTLVYERVLHAWDHL